MYVLTVGTAHLVAGGGLHLGPTTQIGIESTVGLITLKVNIQGELLLPLLNSMARSLERIANHFDLQRGSKTGFTTLYSPEEGAGDASLVGYVDDVDQFVRDQERARFMEKTGRVLQDWEDVPKAVDKDGKPWRENQKA